MKTTRTTHTSKETTRLVGRVRAACLELGGGRQAVRVRIADLRSRLSDVHADVLTATIRDLSRARVLTMYPLENPRSITAADEAAAIYSGTGVAQHIVYYGGYVS